jgi:stage II sporulation protein D
MSLPAARRSSKDPASGVTVPSHGLHATATAVARKDVAREDGRVNVGTARRLLAAAGIALLLAACTGETVSVPTDRPHPSSPPAPSPTTPSLVTDTVRITAPREGSVLVRGAYPESDSRCRDAIQPKLTARYPGRLTVRRQDDGTLSLAVALPFDRYLEGIAEVPPSWPRAALEAQAIAARSYALATTGWDGAEGEELEQQICSTTSCQVYVGMPVGKVGDAPRWWAAVRRTDGRVLLYDGRPAETVYFSTSNGRTYGNDVVFGSSPLPYLRGVVERDDGASPTSHWRTTIPLGDLATYLHEGGLWPGGRRITRVVGDGSRLRVTGARGGTRTIDGAEFRGVVNTWAPCLHPDRFPAGVLPTTIPSRWMMATTQGAGAVFTGRGWGHGAGMVQWGAYGKAKRGYTPERILAAYYGGLRPMPYPEPGLIHVHIVDGLTQLRIVPSDEGAKVEGEDAGAGPIVVTGGDALTVS